MNNSINNNFGNGRISGMVNGVGRMGAGGGGAPTGQDVTDNAGMFNGNGFGGGGGLRTRVISSQSQISSVVRESEKVVKKSFIQQRVEKLYGSAEGVVVNKQIYNNNERKYLNNIANDNVSKNYSNAMHLNGNGSVPINGTGGGGGGGAVANAGGGVGVIGAGGGVGYGGGGAKENFDENNKEIFDDPDMDALPVLRHLRPEFRAQLQIFSPKKVPKSSPNKSISSTHSVNNNNNHIISNGDLSHHSLTSPPLSNGKFTSSSTVTSVSTTQTSSQPTPTTVESKRDPIAVTAATTVTIKSSHQTSRSVSSLGTSTLSTATSANSCDVSTEPTTAANSSHTSGGTSVANAQSTKRELSPAVTEQSSSEKEPICVESVVAITETQQQQKQKMKLNEPVINGAGGGEDRDVTILRNGTSGKNGHHLVEEEKENQIAKAGVSEVKDGNYFLQVLKNEQNRLLTMAADIEKEIEQLKTDGVEISEEIAGYVLVAAGKARLLCSQKMKQFEGLCYKNLNQSPDEKFQTTCEDLRGFWDMVMLQVNDVDASFIEIDGFRRNGWKKPVMESPTPQARSATRTTKLVKRPFKSSSSSPASPATGAESAATDAKKAAAAKRDAQRKQLMELKRKQKLANSQQNVEIFVPNSTTGPVTSVSDNNGVVPAAAVVDAS